MCKQRETSGPASSDAETRQESTFTIGGGEGILSTLQEASDQAVQRETLQPVTSSPVVTRRTSLPSPVSLGVTTTSTGCTVGITASERCRRQSMPNPVNRPGGVNRRRSSASQRVSTSGGRPRSLKRSSSMLSSISSGEFSSTSGDGNRRASTSCYPVKVAARCGTDVMTRGTSKWSVLHNAAWLGNTDEISQLVNVGQDINITNLYNETPLHCALTARREAAIRLLLDLGADPRARNRGGQEVLHIAANDGHLSLVKQLIQSASPAGLNAQDHHHNTPLHVAVQAKHLEIATVLLEAGVDATLSNKRMHTPLHTAVKQADLDMTALLLRYTPFLNMSDLKGFTVLHLAVKLKRQAIIELLLHDQGQKTQFLIDVNSRNKAGKTILHSAIDSGIDKIISMLLAKGAKHNVFYKHEAAIHTAARRASSHGIMLLTRYVCDINMPSGRGQTCLHIAAEHTNDHHFIQYLLKLGADPNLADDGGLTPVCRAVIAGNADVAKLLRSATENTDDETLLYHACTHGHPEMIDILQCDINSPLHPAGDSMPLHIAADKGHIEMESLDAERRTPLHCAITAGQVEMVKKLLELDADVEARDSNGQRAIHLAVQTQSKDMLWIIVDADAAINVAGQDRNTALHQAVSLENLDAIKILLSESAKTDRRNKDGLTPMGLALRRRNTEIIEQLARRAKPEELEDELAGANLKEVALTYGNQMFAHALISTYLEDDQERLKDDIETTQQKLASLIPDETSSDDDGRRGLTVPEKIGNWYRAIIESDVKCDLISLIHDYPPRVPADSGYAFAPVIPVSTKDVEEIKRKRSKRYPMQASPRGLAVILNNVTFHGDGLEERDGSALDADRLEKLFRQLDFEVIRWTNLTSEEILQEIEKLRQSSAFETHDAFILVAMSHGHSDQCIYGTDGTFLYLEKDIFNKFDGINCPALTGKPKLFIWQSCRSRNSQPKGTHFSISPAISPSQEAPSKPVYMRQHSMTDIIQVYSTYSDSKAYRNVLHGAWYIEEFVLIAELFAHKYDINQIDAKARELLQHRRSIHTNEFQLSKLEATQTRKLHFQPGYYLHYETN